MIGRTYLLWILLAVATQADSVDMGSLFEAMESSVAATVAEPESEVVREAGPGVKLTTGSAPDGLPGGPLGMDRAIDLATMNDSRLAPFAAALKLAQLRNESSLQRDNPELRFGTDISGDDPDTRAAVRFFPLHPWAASALKHENSALADEVAAAYRNAVLDTTIETMSLYHELQCLMKEKDLYDRLITIKQQIADLMDQQVAAAAGTQAQGLLAHWEAHESLENRRNVEIKAAQIKQLFAALVGLPIDQFTLTALDDGSGFILLGAEHPTQTALGSRPELQLLRAQRDAADARLRSARSENIPWLNHVEVGYRNNSQRWGLEAAINLPLFTLRGTEKMLAYEELALRDIELETGEQLIRQEVGAAVLAYNIAVNEWNSLRAGHGMLMEKTRTFLDSTPSDTPQQMVNRQMLEEKMIRAEFKMLDVRRNVHKALMELIAIVGKPV